jgi:hypothetical protein
MLATHSGVSGKVANITPEQVANFIPESVANFDRNRWPTCPGIRTGQIASESAAQYCHANGLSIEDNIFSMVPFGIEPDFAPCQAVHAGKNNFERSLVLMNRAKSIFVIGGGMGTEHEVMHAAVEYYMAWGTALRRLR